MPPNIRRFLPMILIALVLLVLLPNLIKKKSGACHAGKSAKCVSAHLVDVNLSAANLTNANFANADLAGADLHAAILTGANFRGANLTGADLMGAVNADLTGAVVCHTLLPSGHFPVHDC